MRATLFAAAALVAALPTTTTQAHGHHYRGGCTTHACAARACASRACKARVGRAARIAAWRAYVRPYRGWLDSTGHCESDSAGGYRLRTTGNGFWFRYQFTAQTWASTGGRVIRGIGPVGMHGEMVPAPLEQDVRAVRALHAQGRGAWPVCG